MKFWCKIISVLYGDLAHDLLAGIEVTSVPGAMPGIVHEPWTCLLHKLFQVTTPYFLTHPLSKKGLLNAEDRPHVSLVANPYGLVFGGFYDKPTQYKLHGAQDTPEKAK